MYMRYLRFQSQPMYMFTAFEKKVNQMGSMDQHISIISPKNGTSSSDKAKTLSTNVSPLPEVEATNRNI